MVTSEAAGDTDPVHDQRGAGELLREWRVRRGLSQLELSVRAGVSSRHISFVETGRTVPSPTMVLRLAEQLNIPLRERNRLLIAAGHAPAYRQRPLDDPDLAAALTAVRRIIDSHTPYPALAVDHRWNLLFANDAAEVFFAGVAPELLAQPINMMRLGLHPKGFAHRLRNLDRVRGFLLPRLARQAAQTGDADLYSLHRELAAFGESGHAHIDAADIALPIELEHRGAVLRLFNTITTFGAAFDVTLDDIAVEAYFPADPDTANHLRALAEPD
ncbi:helix-turn-helix domain-containing protein [Nocardia cyriacigeorgica]|uniref:helix-turn-helix domain-containing protein n=1 Tax=Nocardia cyriacigeorgica TaxID=135487 RepID=UPI0024575206|nr:helix-turn-helix transcriptional regulator [Nocardia cyriacigeorgica]